MRRRLVSLLLAYIGNGEGFAGDGAESLLAFLLAGKLAAGGGKLGVAVDGGEYPVRFGWRSYRESSRRWRGKVRQDRETDIPPGLSVPGSPA